MSHFHADLTGSTQQITRTGTKNSGIRAHIRGWNIGVRIILKHVEGRDILEVWETTGSRGPLLGSDKLLTIIFTGA